MINCSLAGVNPTPNPPTIVRENKRAQQDTHLPGSAPLWLAPAPARDKIKESNRILSPLTQHFPRFRLSLWPQHNLNIQQGRGLLNYLHLSHSVGSIKGGSRFICSINTWETLRWRGAGFPAPGPPSAGMIYDPNIILHGASEDSGQTPGPPGNTRNLFWRVPLEFRNASLTNGPCYSYLTVVVFPIPQISLQ